jgi:hypothetical protein
MPQCCSICDKDERYCTCTDNGPPRDYAVHKNRVDEPRPRFFDGVEITIAVLKSAIADTKPDEQTLEKIKTVIASIDQQLKIIISSLELRPDC